MLKFYKSMTLLNTMDRILYESQRQVRGLRLALGGAGKDARSPCLLLGQKITPKEEKVGWRSFVLGCLESLELCWYSEGGVWEGCCRGMDQISKKPSYVPGSGHGCAGKGQAGRLDGPFTWELTVLRNRVTLCASWGAHVRCAVSLSRVRIRGQRPGQSSVNKETIY